MSTSLMPTLPKLVFSSRTTERTAMMNGLTLVSDTALRHRQGWKLLSPVALRTPYAKSLKTPLLWLCQMPNPISHSIWTSLGDSITLGGIFFHRLGSGECKKTGNAQERPVRDPDAVNTGHDEHKGSVFPLRYASTRKNCQTAKSPSDKDHDTNSTRHDPEEDNRIDGFAGGMDGCVECLGVKRRDG